MGTSGMGWGGGLTPVEDKLYGFSSYQNYFNTQSAAASKKQWLPKN